MKLFESLSHLPPTGYIILLLIFAATVALLGSLSGVGGGVLHIPVMLWVLTIPMQEIKFISTILVFISALINTTIGAIKKETNYWIILIGFVVATPTVFLGNFLNDKISNNITELIIMLLLVYVSIQLIVNHYIFKKKNVEQKQITRHWFHVRLKNSPKLINIFFFSGIVFFAAMVTSLTGMGGGVIIMPFLLIIVKLNFKESAPISHSVILITSLLSLIIEPIMGANNFFLDRHAMINITIPMAFGAITGTLVAIFVKKFVKKEVIILWLLVILIWSSIAKMLYDLIIAWA